MADTFLIRVTIQITYMYYNYKICMQNLKHDEHQYLEYNDNIHEQYWQLNLYLCVSCGNMCV